MYSFYERVSVIPRTESIYKTLEDMSPSEPPIAYFQGIPSKGESIFTADGFCHTFNSLNSRDIYSDV